MSAQNKFAHLRSLLDQFFAEVYSHVLVDGIVEVDICLLDEALGAVSVPFDYQEVDDQLVEQGGWNLNFIQSLPPELECVRRRVTDRQQIYLRVVFLFLRLHFRLGLGPLHRHHLAVASTA